MKIRKQKITGFIPLLLLIVVFAFSIGVVAAASNNSSDETLVNGSNNASVNGTNAIDDVEINIDKINGKVPDYPVISPGGKVKVSVSAYYKKILPLSFRHLNFTFHQYLPSNGVTWSKITLTDLFGLASVTFDTRNQPNGKYEVEVFYTGAPNRVEVEYFSIGPTSSDEQSWETDANNGSNQSSTSDKPVSDETVPMKDTGTPISALVLSVLAVISGLVYNKR